MKTLLENLNRVLRKEDGQSMVEYALIVALVAVALIVILTQLGENVETIFQDIINALSGTGSD
ncbi:pilus assembly protein Flp/PilA [Desulfitispora alkaliphila]|uniref:Flp family type IVb pilin n=1 Tax=Desulfitispora alkaliphila TaxID=622674 RepID=UPI003D1E172B